ncbi:MAG: hypothetical protein QOD38_148 [Acidimicrobiaceae bacterium]|jgi:hypothetical protein
MRFIGRIAAFASIALLSVALTGGTSSPGAAAAGTPQFTTPIALTGATGGEPGIDNDKAGNVYVVGPQGIPAGVGGNPGVAFWVSHDNADSFTNAAFLGSFLGGGDSDVAVGPDDAAVWLADLEAIAGEICISHDKAATFNGIGPIPDPNHCTNVNTGQAGPSNDRQWLTVDKGGRAYFTYHEFVTAYPMMFRTDNGGGDLFANVCGPLVTDPTVLQNVPTDITGGTLVSRPVLDSQGNIYVMFTSTTQPQNADAIANGHVSGTFSQIYLAKSTDHCATFTDITVFDGSVLGTNTVQFGDDFNVLAIDGADHLYAVAAGFVGTTPFAPVAHLYLLSSSDGGTTWTDPLQIDSDGGAHMLPAGVGGPAGGQLALGYFHTTNDKTDPNDVDSEWTYTVALSTDAASGTPSFTTTDIQAGHIFHKGDICNQGILCIEGDRSLLDFSAATVDGHGCVIYTWAGHTDPGQETDAVANYVSRQTTECFALPVAATTPVTSGPVTTTPRTGSSSTAFLLVGAAFVVLALGLRRVRRSQTDLVA